MNSPQERRDDPAVGGILRRFARRFSRDGWEQSANPHEPGKRIVLPNGRVYRVDKHGAWHRQAQDEGR